MKADKSKTKNYKFNPVAIWKLYRRLGYHLQAHRGKMAGAAVCMVGATIAEILKPWPIKVIFDSILIPQQDPGQIINWLTLLTGSESILLVSMVVSILVIASVGGFFSFGQAYLLSSTGQKVVAGIRMQLYAHIQRLSQSFHDERSTGDLMARLTEDVRMMRDLLVNSVIFMLARALVVLGTFAVMIVMDWQLALVSVAIVPLLALVAYRFSGEIKGAARRQRRKESKIAQAMTESIGAIKVVQAYARESYEEERFSEQNKASAKADLVATRLEANMDRLVQIILAIGTCLVIWFGVHRVKAGILTPGDLLVFTAYLAGLYKPIRKLASLTGRTSKAVVCGERITDILDLKPEIHDSETAVSAPHFRGEVEFQNVSFSYSRGDGVLRGASFRMASKETVVLMSESGSGKTTVANLLLRFYDPHQGAVLIDGQDIRGYTLASLRDQIAVVLQESVLFNATIRDNIAYGKLNATDAEVISAAKAANAHSFILSLPDAYDTVVGERGATLSGGQRQRIAIARAFIRDAGILILDEPLTGLDRENEDGIRIALKRLMHGRTTLIITHDPATAQLGDRVLTIKKGKVEEVTAYRVPLVVSS